MLNCGTFPVKQACGGGNPGTPGVRVACGSDSVGDRARRQKTHWTRPMIPTGHFAKLMAL
jgi:hypothetical protein